MIKLWFEMFICATCIKLLFASKCNYSKHFILQTQMSRIETNQNDFTIQFKYTPRVYLRLFEEYNFK